MQSRRCTLVMMIMIFSVQILFIYCDNSTIDNSTIKGSGNIATDERSVSGYTSISFSGAGKLNITEKTTELLKITTDNNLMEYIETTVQNGVLIIEFRDGVSLEPSDTIIFDLAVIELNGILFSGAGSIQANAFDVSSGTFDLSVSGGAECVIDGQVDHQNIIVSGTCTYDASDFESKTAYVDISGVGDLTLWVSDTINGSISGVGNVYYYDSPVTKIDITGLGKVEGLGPK